METLQIRLTGELVKKVGALIDNGTYPNRSEAIRDAVRRLISNGAADIKKSKEFIVLFSSDLHGNTEQYVRLFCKALKDGVNAIIIGGDITPKDPAHRTPESQRDFLIMELFPLIENFHKQCARSLHECKVYLMMGNDDFKSNYGLLKRYENKIGFKLIHERCFKLHEDFKIIGYSFVPLTPFRYKDWEKPDLTTVREEFTRKGKFVTSGVRSRNGKLVEYEIDLKNRTRTIEKDLNRLFELAGTGKIILVSHAPPKNTNLDIISTNEHVGSDAIRKIIEERQPYVVLSGHIHETVNKSGTFKHRLANTTCMSSGNDHTGKKVAAIEFNLYALEEARRLII